MRGDTDLPPVGPIVSGDPKGTGRLVGIDDGRIAWVEQDDSANLAGWFLHRGVRIVDWPHPKERGWLVLQLLGGGAAAPGFEEEGVTFEITIGGLEALACDLIAAAGRAKAALILSQALSPVSEAKPA